MGSRDTKMRRFLCAMFLVLPVNALAAERRFSVTDFDRIRLIGPFSVTLETGKSPTARAIGSSESLEQISLEIQGRLLTIKPNRSAWGGWPGDKPVAARVSLSGPMIRGVSLEGAGVLKITRIKGTHVTLSVQGSGVLEAPLVETDRLDISSSGAGSVTVGGSAKSLMLLTRGSGSIDATALKVSDAQITWESAGNLSVTVARAAKVTSIGSGIVTIIGNPACTVSTLGAGEVFCGK